MLARTRLSLRSRSGIVLSIDADATFFLVLDNNKPVVVLQLVRKNRPEQIVRHQPQKSTASNHLGSNNCQLGRTSKPQTQTFSHLVSDLRASRHSLTRPSKLIASSQYRKCVWGLGKPDQEQLPLPVFVSDQSTFNGMLSEYHTCMPEAETSWAVGSEVVPPLISAKDAPTNLANSSLRFQLAPSPPG
ncbi:Glutamyl-tRNA(Gln) amidotransferase subunit A [Fusarium oxysporum f. sp. albedinis]|nr:Glutamyl-tRNA(Gln) amidotransferase subunit A [Fusarium oxysporum f. sp. albedinis]